MKIRFLLDENLPPKLKSAVLNLQPEIDILRVGDSNAPTLGTLDSEILIYLESSKRLLVTDNRKSIPGHLEEHWAAGGQSWGLVWVRPSGSIGRWAETIHFIWETTEAEEWIDKLDWIPY
ncbi:hypothetical protein C7B67_24095 [filamentous cyanobacterium Phorm 6]|nr:hypothetical protein C7B67_24095 [filamentous cyanobacterium Phorm 6]